MVVAAPYNDLVFHLFFSKNERMSVIGFAYLLNPWYLILTVIMILVDMVIAVKEKRGRK